MRAPARQRGVLLIAAVVIIMAAGVMALVIVTLVAGGSRAGAQQLQATRALYIAESGLERAVHAWNLDDTYAGEGPLAFGGGSYTVTVFDTDASGAPLPAGKKRLRSVGALGSNPPAERTVEVIVSRDLFAEQFPSDLDFTTNWGDPSLAPFPNNEGTAGFDSNNCPAATCPDTLAPPSGSMMARTDTAGPNDRLIGYAERELPTAIATGAGMSIDLEVAYEKTTGNNPQSALMAVALYDSNMGVETQIWSNTDTTTGAWLLGTATGVALPANQNYDHIRLRFDLEERGNNTVSVWFDEIRIRESGVNVVREAWLEVFP